MEKLLFIFAVVLITIALVSKTKLHHNIDDDSSEAVVEDNFRDDTPQSLTYAMAQVTKSAPLPVAAPQKVPAQMAPTPQQPPANEKTGLEAEVSGYVKQIQAANDQSLQALEKGLAITTGSDAQGLRLSLLQAALNLRNADPSRLSEIAMHEMTGTVVEPVTNSSVLNQDDFARTETSRNMVSTSYKIYLNFSHDPQQVLQDTLQVLNFQRDQVTRDLIIYDCVARYPDLRGKLQSN